MKIKYPRTPHLPWSKGNTSDDIFSETLDVLKNCEVVVTEKMDGECTTMYFDYIHSRSLTNSSHPSRDYVKRIWSEIKFQIPKSFRIVGENIYARHSIYYDCLPSYFLVFAIFDGDTCLSWKETEEWCELLGFQIVPVLYKGVWDEDKIKKCMTDISKYGDIQEGYVVRNKNKFLFSEFQYNIAKYVRENHVQTNSHWMYQKIEINKLKVTKT